MVAILIILLIQILLAEFSMDWSEKWNNNNALPVLIILMSIIGISIIVAMAKTGRIDLI